eukprot:1450640-Heterocapsa_arctica.AAC.1
MFIRCLQKLYRVFICCPAVQFCEKWGVHLLVVDRCSKLFPIPSDDLVPAVDLDRYVVRS